MDSVLTTSDSRTIMVVSEGLKFLFFPSFQTKIQLFHVAFHHNKIYFWREFIVLIDEDGDWLREE